MKAYKDKLQNVNPKWSILNAPVETMFSFGLIQHTKQNPNRLHTFARTNLTWIGSRDNYIARIKRRWPIRFFLAYTAPSWFAYGPIQRIQLKIQRAKHLRWLSSQQIALDEAIRSAIGTIPENRGELFTKLTAAFPDQPDLVRRVDVSYGLSHRTVLRLKQEHQEAADKIHARPGEGTKLIVEYPEAELVHDLQNEIDRVLGRIGRDAMELAKVIEQREIIVVNQIADV